MPYTADELSHVPLFSLLDKDELAILAQQVELREFAPRQRIYKAGDAGNAGLIFRAGIDIILYFAK